MTYYIYHIPGQKIGVTRNLNKRVTQQQGYAEDEYEVLFEGNDIDLISKLEIELQLSYGYPVDPTPYNKLFKPKTMKVNPTEQTTTFPVPVDKLKGRLIDNLGMTWETPQGYVFEINGDTLPWIMKNVRTSHFNPNRSYIYNKAFKVFTDELKTRPNYDTAYDPDEDHADIIPVFSNIRKWATDRGIYDEGNVKTQFAKLVEEVGELAQAILKDDDLEFSDAVGDCVVVLTNLAALNGHVIEDCIDGAYRQIQNRRGAMQNGTFVKEDSRPTLEQALAKTDIHPESSFGLYLKRKSQSL